jgi:hypothetical protein
MIKSTSFIDLLQKIRSKPFNDLIIAELELTQAIRELRILRKTEREQRLLVRKLQDKVEVLRRVPGAKNAVPANALVLAKLPRFF